MESGGSESGVATPGLESSASQTTIMTTFNSDCTTTCFNTWQTSAGICDIQCHQNTALCSINHFILYTVKMILRGARSVMPRFPTMGQISSRSEPGNADSSASLRQYQYPAHIHTHANKTVAYLFTTQQCQKFTLVSPRFRAMSGVEYELWYRFTNRTVNHAQ